MATLTVVYSSAITTNSTSYTAVCLPTVGELIIAIARSGATTGDPVCTDNKGGTYTLVSTAAFNSTAASMAAFIGNQLVTTSSMTITFGWTGDAADGCCKAVYSASGITRTGASALKQTARINNSASTTMQVTLSANASSSNPLIAALGNLTNPATVTEPSGWTEGSDTGHATPVNGFETAYTNSTFNGTAVTWGSSSASVCGAMVLELDTSVLPAGGMHYRTLMGVGL